jgi:hypothetical protein
MFQAPAENLISKPATTVDEGGFDDYPGFVLALRWNPDCGDQPARGPAPEAAAIPSARWQAMEC